MANGGLVNGRGIDYQKEVFLFCILNHFASFDSFVYEGDDDIVCLNHQTNITWFFQAKTGDLSEERQINAILCWLRLDVAESNMYLLISEKENSFDFDSLKEKTWEALKDGKNRRPDSNANKAYVALFPDDVLDYSAFEERIGLIQKRFRSLVLSIPNLRLSLVDAYKRAFGLGNDDDISQIEKRVNLLKKYVVDRISDSLLASRDKEIVFTFAEIQHENEHLTVDYPTKVYRKYLSVFKNESALGIILDDSIREVRQLKSVFPNDDSRILSQLINEAFYRDFKGFYCGLNRLEDMESIENRAYSNYIFAKDEMELRGSSQPKELWLCTVQKPLDDALLGFPDASYCKQGCYVHLSSEAAPEDLRITWQKESE